MRIFLLSISLFFSFFLTSQAQVRVALVGGPHQATVKETNQLPNWDSIGNNYLSRVSGHIGLIADIPFSTHSHFYFQPGVMLSGKGRKYAGSADTAIYSVQRINTSQFINYIDVPLNLVLKFGKKTKFIIGGGPYISFFYNGKEKTETLYKNGDFMTEEKNDLPVGNAAGKYSVFDYGVNALAGFEFGRVFITGNYSQGLSDFYQADYEGSFKHQLIGGTLGIFLGRTIVPEPVVKDKDKDGIPDAEDGCPDAPGTAATNGCPDKDGDGIADKDDKCPDVAGLRKNNGCPVLDADADGINDAEDKCPTIAGIAKYNGCPVPDTDKDGINDELDKCPTVAGVARYGGCPVPDTDKDGINDEQDKCPTLAGTKENNGCPVIKKEIIAKVNIAAKRIQFKFQKADLLPESFKVLNDVIAILKQNPELNVSIEGHTSSDGEPSANMKLSQNRALSVKKYFEVNGINSARLKAVGFGQTQPLNQNKNAAEKAQNRRVELKLSNQ